MLRFAETILPEHCLIPGYRECAAKSKAGRSYYQAMEKRQRSEGSGTGTAGAELPAQRESSAMRVLPRYVAGRIHSLEPGPGVEYKQIRLMGNIWLSLTTIACMAAPALAEASATPRTPNCSAPKDEAERGLHHGGSAVVSVLRACQRPARPGLHAADLHEPVRLAAPLHHQSSGNAVEPDGHKPRRPHPLLSPPAWAVRIHQLDYAT